MQRIVSVWLPLWPIERMQRASPGLVPQQKGRDRPRPFALVESGVHGLVLTAVDARAGAEGLRAGQALADARAAVPGLLTRPAECEQDLSALRSLARWCGRYGPRRNCQGEAGAPPDGLWIDVTGVAHLFGGEEAMLTDLARRLRIFGLTARLGLADTSGAAFALARYAHRTGRGSPWTIAPAGRTSDALAVLPVDALRLSADSIVLLKRLGLRRIGQLYELPRDALAQRFRADTGPAKARRKREREAIGLAGIVLARLDQALGTASEPLLPMEEPPAAIVRQSFPEPLISTEGVSAAAEALAIRLCTMLEDAGQGGTRFSLDLYRADGSSSSARIGLSRPGRDPSHILDLLAGRLEAIDAGFGIDVMSLSAMETAPLAPDQIALPANGMKEHGTGTGLLVDRLSNRLGRERVLRLAAVESHIPERAELLRPALWSQRQSKAAPPLAAPRGRTSGARRPLLLLPAPEPISVTAEVPEGPPLRFTWRRLSRRVLRAEGPERIEPEWWRGIGRRWSRHEGTFARPRDYYRVEDVGGARYWVFRAGLYGREDDSSAPPVWFMHGVFG